MNATDQLNALSGHHSPDVSTGGRPTRIWAADVVTVNPDGSVDCQPVSSRATKVGVLCPGGYTPTVGDRVLVADLNGDPRLPIVLTSVSAAAQTSVTNLQGRAVSSAVPGSNQALVWNGSSWAPANAVNSFNGRTGAVTPQAGDYPPSLIGALAKASNLSDLASAATARTNLGLGSAATQNATAFLQLLSAGTVQIAFGATGTLASGGQVTVSHGLPRTPTVVLATNNWADGTSSAFYTVFTITSTQFTVINKGSTNGAAFWLAIG